MNNKTKKKKEQQLKARKKIRKARQDSVLDSFYKYTGISISDNAFYALKDNPKFNNIIQEVDASIPLSNNKETRDRALHHLTKALVMFKIAEEKIKDAE